MEEKGEFSRKKDKTNTVLSRAVITGRGLFFGKNNQQSPVFYGDSGKILFVFIADAKGKGIGQGIIGKRVLNAGQTDPRAFFG